MVIINKFDTENNFFMNINIFKYNLYYIINTFRSTLIKQFRLM